MSHHKVPPHHLPSSVCAQQPQARSSSGGSLSVNAVLAYARNYAALRLRHKNPFVDHLSQDAAAGVAAGGAPSSGSGSGSSGGTAHSAQQQQVLTFEVGFADVVGLDFRWPLTEEPRLVLEAACLCKRVFDSVRLLLVWAGVGRFMRVLDVGCGCGGLSSEQP